MGYKEVGEDQGRRRTRSGARPAPVASPPPAKKKKKSPKKNVTFAPSSSTTGGKIVLKIVQCNSRATKRKGLPINAVHIDPVPELPVSVPDAVTVTAVVPVSVRNVHNCSHCNSIIHFRKECPWPRPYPETLRWPPPAELTPPKKTLSKRAFDKWVNWASKEFPRIHSRTQVERQLRAEAAAGRAAAEVAD